MSQDFIKAPNNASFRQTDNTAQVNQISAVQSQSPGAWYNPLPTPYAYGQFPTNGGSIYDPSMMGGMNPMMMGGMNNPMMMGGMNNPMMMGGMNNPMMMGGMYGSPAVTGNVYGGYDYQNNNPNSALPGYGYNRVVAPTSFTTPLSGTGVDPLYTGNRIYQDHFSTSNAPFVTWASGLTGAFVGGTLWAQTAGRGFRGARGWVGRTGNFLQVGAVLAGAVIGAITGNRFFDGILKAQYTGLDHADNGILDGSYTTQRGNDVSLPRLLT